MNLEARDALRHALTIMSRLDELATISADVDALTRLNLTREHRRANDLAGRWMQEAGMIIHTDVAGNLVGRYEGSQPGAPALLLGSHLDTVRDAGRYDGALGVVLAVALVGILAERSHRLGFAIEVIGFADEEGVRFHAGLLGSKAVVGSLEPTSLALTDDDGITLADALRSFGLDPNLLNLAAKEPTDIVGYLEVHIEQGPVLERANASVGVVTGIAGAVRHRVSVLGRSGHAGTVPMNARNDALAAAAECVLALETLCHATGDAVGTVGELNVSRGAVNVIPGRVQFSVDIRAAEDAVRSEVDQEFRREVAAICARRGTAFELRPVHESPACAFGGPLSQTLMESVVAEGLPLHRLPSGAGHDAMTLAGFTDTAMLFVRCKGGVSHDPSESTEVEDVQAALAVTFRTVLSLDSQKASSRCT